MGWRFSSSLPRGEPNAAFFVLVGGCNSFGVVERCPTPRKGASPLEPRLTSTHRAFQTNLLRFERSADANFLPQRQSSFLTHFFFIEKQRSFAT
jgi:hypothetical protein